MQRKVRKFFKLGWPERVLLIEALGCVWAARVACWCSRRWFLRRLPTTQPLKRSRNADIVQVVWAIGATATMVPNTTCLIRAIAGQWLLARYGYCSCLRIGVCKSPTFEAHAWVEVDGKPVIGNLNLEAYTRLALPARLGQAIAV